MAEETRPVRVLFVCTGNICRSPMAEGAFRAMVEACGLAGRIEADSAGTIDYHVGEAPDPRAGDTALTRGFDISGQRARRIGAEDYDLFDILVALDESHLAALARRRPRQATAEIRLLLKSAPQTACKDVPDPYYGELSDFQSALDLIEAGCAGLLDEIRRGLQEADRALRDARSSPFT